MQSDDLLYQRLPAKGGEIGLITLNRPSALNALNHDMIRDLYRTLCAWRDDQNCLAVIVQATEGRAFCAGGDIRHLYHSAHSDTVLDFFWDEYRLNHCIHHYPKPYIALMNGITMGGGVGISQHGSHRVVTRQFQFAMPETTIGFFPDVGATYFLPRLQGALGLYLGLTGARLSASDSLLTGLADIQVSEAQLPSLITALCDSELSNAAISDTLTQFSEIPSESTVASQLESINRLFAQSSIDAVFDALNNDTDDFAASCLADLKRKSPSSLKVTFEALRRGADLSFDHCMQMEYRLVQHFLQQHDFMEGVRALLIDKDKNPNWQPATLAEITTQETDAYFSAMDDRELSFEESSW